MPVPALTPYLYTPMPEILDTAQVQCISTQNKLGECHIGNE
jgi:hypothetical protein